MTSSRLFSLVKLFDDMMIASDIRASTKRFQISSIFLRLDIRAAEWSWRSWAPDWQSEVGAVPSVTGCDYNDINLSEYISSFLLLHGGKVRGLGFFSVSSNKTIEQQYEWTSDWIWPLHFVYHCGLNMLNSAWAPSHLPVWLCRYPEHLLALSPHPAARADFLPSKDSLKTYHVSICGEFLYILRRHSDTWQDESHHS